MDQYEQQFLDDNSGDAFILQVPEADIDQLFDHDADKVHSNSLVAMNEYEQQFLDNSSLDSLARAIPEELVEFQDSQADEIIRLYCLPSQSDSIIENSTLTHDDDDADSIVRNFPLPPLKSANPTVLRNHFKRLYQTGYGISGTASGGGSNLNVQFEEISESNMNAPRLRRNQIITDFQLRHNMGQISDLFKVETKIDNSYAVYMDGVLANFDQSDTYSVGIYTDTANLFIPPKSISRFNKKEFLNTILRVIQSDQTLLDDGRFTLSVGVMRK